MSEENGAVVNIYSKNDPNKILKRLSDTQEMVDSYKRTTATISIDGYEEIEYERKPQHRCSLCRHELAKEAEAVYLKNGKNCYKVQLWFEEKGYTVHWITVKTHMDKHCVFTATKIDWLSKISDRVEEFNFNEAVALQFGMAGLMDQMAELKSIDVSDNLKESNDIAKTMSTLFSTYLGYVRAQFEIAGMKKDANLKIAEMSTIMSKTLMDMHEKAGSQEVKDMIENAARELSDKIQKIVNTNK